MNLLIAEKVAGSFQKIGVMNGDDFLVDCLLAYGLACNAKRFFEGEPAAESLDYLLEGIEYRVSKF
jgi:hypothetical protein